jgi:hypothetical protein
LKNETTKQNNTKNSIANVKLFSVTKDHLDSEAIEQHEYK